MNIYEIICTSSNEQFNYLTWEPTTSPCKEYNVEVLIHIRLSNNFFHYFHTNIEIATANRFDPFQKKKKNLTLSDIYETHKAAYQPLIFFELRTKKNSKRSDY